MRLNSALPMSFRDPEPVVAAALCEIVSKISPDVRSAMRLEMRLAGADGDMNKTTFVILSVLGDLDADNLHDALNSQHGAALLGRRDPVPPVLSKPAFGNTPEHQGADTPATNFRPKPGGTWSD